MAKEHKSNVSSPSRSTTKASAPSPTNVPNKESVSPEKSPSNQSDSPPLPSEPPPSPPSPSHSSPPSPSNSSPPSLSPSPPPPSKSSAPPPRSSPPPSKNSPSSPPPSPSLPPPTLPPSPPPPPPPPLLSPPPPPPPSSSQPPNIGSPPPSTSPPPPQVTTPPSPGSFASPPPPPQTRPPTPQPQPPPVSPGSHAKQSAPSSKSYAPSTSPSSSNNKTGQYISFAFAAVFAVAFMAIIVFMVLRRKDKRGNVYGSMPPPKKSQMKGDEHYYVEDPGFGNGTQDMYYSTRNHAGNMQHLGTPPDAAQQPMSAGQIVFSYDKIVEITDGFSGENVIGEGGFGRVYKASMPDGRVGAVKLLKAGSGQGEREFKAEVEIISRVHHRHLVSLIGYCISEQERVLIYEFVPNGTLDQHLHESERMVLDWPKRMKIAIGAARGLAYLHEGCNPKIIHRDIKSANILLDDAYEAQVADFGLARLTNDANTHVSTRVMGTFGYMAPEYATSGKLTDRSDVFSFGVVLLELVTGRKPVDPDQPVGDESLVEWARPLLLRAVGTGDYRELVDPRLEQQYVDSEMFRMIEAAAACVRHSAQKRPSMVQIARALDSGDQLYDLSNGVKYGQSTVYDSGQYNEEIRRFNGRDNNSSFGDSEFDMYSREYNSRDMSGPARIPTQSSSADLEIRTFQGQRSNADYRF